MSPNNGKPASEFIDNARDGRLDRGAIALQIHDKGMRVELTQLHHVIKKLMDASTADKTPEERTEFAKVEYRARKCRDKMIELTAVAN